MDLGSTSAAPVALNTLAASLPDVQRAADEPPTQADESVLTIDDGADDDDEDDIDAPTQAMDPRPVAFFDPERAKPLTEANAPKSKVPARAATLTPAASLSPTKSPSPTPAATPPMSSTPPQSTPPQSTPPKPATSPTTPPTDPAHHHPVWKRLPRVISVSLLVAIITIIAIVIIGVRLLIVYVIN